MVTKITPDIKQEEIQEIYNRKSYSTGYELRIDIWKLRKYLISLSYALATAEKKFALKECEYREIIGKRLSKSKCFSYQEKIADLLGQFDDIKDKYEEVCACKEEYVTFQKLEENVTKFTDSLEKMSYYAKDRQ